MDELFNGFANGQNQVSIPISRSKQILFVRKEIESIQKNDTYKNVVKFVLDDANGHEFIVIITPQDGLYKDISIEFLLTIPPNYPAPGNKIQVKCLEYIFHPNLYKNGSVCLTYDGIGNMENGYKETLNHLIDGLIYLFLQPGNQTENEMSLSMKDMIIKNVEEYKKRQIIKTKNNGSMYLIKEIYVNDINDSLKKLKGWESLFPKHIYEKKMQSRNYVQTLSGRFSQYVKFDDILSSIIHDPRFIFVNAIDEFMAGNITEQKMPRGQLSYPRKIMTPITDNHIMVSKAKKIIYPTDISYSESMKKYQINTLFLGTESTFTPYQYVCFNIKIKSNHKFDIIINHNPNVKQEQTSHKLKPFRLQKSSQYIDGHYEVTIDELTALSTGNSLNEAFHNRNFFDYSNMIFVDNLDSAKQIRFDVEHVTIVFGKNVMEFFQNCVFKFNGFTKIDNNNQNDNQDDNQDTDDIDDYYFTLDEEEHVLHTRDQNKFSYLISCDDEMFTAPPIRMLTDREVKTLKSNSDDENDKALIEKYIASNMIQTGLPIVNFT